MFIIGLVFNWFYGFVIIYLNKIPVHKSTQHQTIVKSVYKDIFVIHQTYNFWCIVKKLLERVMCIQNNAVSNSINCNW